jgi:hypothetical protein
MVLLIMELEPEPLELLKIIGLDLLEIQEVQELDHRKLFCCVGVIIGKLLMIMDLLQEIGQYLLSNDTYHILFINIIYIFILNILFIYY